MIRFMVLVAAVLAVSVADVSAQSRQLKSARGRTVFVVDEDRREWHGRLIRVSIDALEVESDAGIRTFKLAEIRRVDADGDAVWDGLLKGFALGATFGLLAVANHAEPWVILSNGLTTGLIGLAIDSGCSARHPVFHGTGAPRLDPAGPVPPAMSLSVRLGW